MKIVRFPIDSAAWSDNIFGQTTVFSFGDRELSLAVLFEAPDDENYHMRGLEKAWEAATTTAFIHRGLTAEELIEKVLTAINGAIKESSITLDGAVLLTEGMRIHFSTIGDTSVLLTDERTINLVSSGQKATEFTAVTSGEVDKTDNILLVPTFLSEQLRSLGRINFEKLEELCHNEKTLVIAAVQDQSPLLVDSDVVSVPRREIIANIGSGVSEKISATTNKLLTLVRTIKLPKIAIKLRLPKWRFRVPPFRLNSLTRPVNIIAVVIFIAVLYYGSTVVRERITAARQVEQPAKTILDRLRETDSSGTVEFLNTEFEFQQYQQLNADEQKGFRTLLAERQIEPFTTAVKQELPERIVDATTIGEMFYFIDASGQLWKYDSKTLQKIEQSGLIIEPQRILQFKEERILVTDRSGNIWLYDGAPTQPISLPLPQSLSSGIKLLAKYSNNLYIYIGNTKLIYRIGGFDRDIINPSLYSKVDSVGLAELRDLYITGDAIGLDITGKIQIFSRSVAAGQVNSVASATARLVAFTGGWAHVNRRLITSYNATLGVSRTSFVLSQDEPSMAIYVGEKLSFVTAGRNLLTTN